MSLCPTVSPYSGQKVVDNKIRMIRIAPEPLSASMGVHHLRTLLTTTLPDYLPMYVRDRYIEQGSICRCTGEKRQLRWRALIN